MAGALQLAGALGWVTAYLLIIRRGYLDHDLGMPLAALAGNLAIEALFSGPFAAGAPPGYPTVYRLWLLLDLLILWQALRFGPRHYPVRPPFRSFSTMLAGAVCAAVALVTTTTLALHDRDGRYSAFVVNAIMSALFVRMVQRRQDVGGQSLPIAVAKLIGTGAFTMFVALGPSPSPFVVACGLLSAVFDIVYTRLLARRIRALGGSLWRRW